MRENKETVSVNVDINTNGNSLDKNSNRPIKTTRKKIHDILKLIVWLSLLSCFACFHFVWETAMIISLSVFFISFFIFTFFSSAFNIPDLGRNAGVPSHPVDFK